MSKRNVSCITTTTNKIVTIDEKRKKCKPSPITPITPNTATMISNRLDSSINVLIVDDNPVNLGILKKYLIYIFDNKLNKLNEACNGAEALDLLKIHTFDLILLDIDMPILNGVETTKKIRETSSIPIIAVTTNDSIKSRQIYSEVGMNACLSKPVDINLLAQTIYNTLLVSSASLFMNSTSTPSSPLSPSIKLNECS